MWVGVFDICRPLGRACWTAALHLGGPTSAATDGADFHHICPAPEGDSSKNVEKMFLFKVSWGLGPWGPGSQAPRARAQESDTLSCSARLQQWKAVLVLHSPGNLACCAIRLVSCAPTEKSKAAEPRQPS